MSMLGAVSILAVCAAIGQFYKFLPLALINKLSGARRSTEKAAGNSKTERRSYKKGRLVKLIPRPVGVVVKDIAISAEGLEFDFLAGLIGQCRQRPLRCFFVPVLSRRYAAKILVTRFIVSPRKLRFECN